MMTIRSKWIINALTWLAVIGLAECASRPSPWFNNNRDVVGPSRPTEKFRILCVLPHPGKSHFNMFRPLLEELGRRGHDLTVVSYFPRDNSKNPPMPNYRDINLANKSSDVFLNIVDLGDISHSPITVFLEMSILRAWGIEACKNCLNNPAVQKLIRSDAEFDLVLTEGFNTDCALGFLHRFKAPSIILSSHDLMPWTSQRMSNEDNPSYVPSTFHGCGPSMTFFERTINAITLPILKFIYQNTFNPPTQSLIESAFGPGVPELSEIAKNTSLVLVNTHFSLQGSKPQLPNVIEVGGIHISPVVQPLPDDIQSYLDKAHEGVLYFSFGSMIKATTMPAEKLKAIVNVIGSLPRKVIWKWESKDLPNQPSNLLTRKWLPQAAILQHPNVRCFMAHGGMLGLSEGVYAGVPMLVVPIFGDQFHNAAAVKARGAAEVLKWDDFTESRLRVALDRVFNDTSYTANARALSRAYRDRPATPLETAVWWTEYIAHGNGIPYLRSAAQDLTWYQYYLLDVIYFVTAILLGCLYAVYSLVRLFIRRQSRSGDFSSRNGSTLSGKKTTKRD